MITEPITEQTSLELPGIAPIGTRCEPGAPLNREHYTEQCRKKYNRDPLRNALANWSHWEALKPDLLSAMKQYRRNPTLEDMVGVLHNPTGTLTDLLWKMQTAWQPDASCLAPLLDFCEHYRKVFLRRGLIIYCSMLLRQIEGKE